MFVINWANISSKSSGGVCLSSFLGGALYTDNTGSKFIPCLYFFVNLPTLLAWMWHD